MSFKLPLVEVEIGTKYLHRAKSPEGRVKSPNLTEISVRFGFLEEVTPVACLLETSDRKLWKGITSSTESPLADLLPPSKARPLRNRGHTYILPQIRTERFKRCFINRCFFNYI